MMKVKNCLCTAIVSAIISAALFMAACESPVEAPLLKRILATEVRLDSTELTLAINETASITASVLPINAVDKTVTWSTDNEDVAAISADGLSVTVTGLAAGTAHVSAASANGIKGTATITVEAVQVSGLTLDDLDLAVNATVTMTAVVTPTNATWTTAEWSSDDETVATVSGSGLTATVTGIAAGAAHITVTLDGETAATATVTVVEIIPLVDVTLGDVSVVINDTATMTAAVDPVGATWTTAVWSTDDPTEAIIAVSGNGLSASVTGIAVGTAQVTITIDGEKTATATVTVDPIAVSAVTLNTNTLELETGSTETLTAGITPPNATDQTLTWQSSDPSVATVSGNGLTATVNAVGAGTATITVSSVNGKTDTAAVTVADPAPGAPSGVILNKTYLEMETGGAAETLTAGIVPEDADDQTVSWQSSDPSVATVSGNGLTATVNAVGAGTAEITVTTSNGKTAAATVVVTTPRTNKYQLKVRNLKTSGLNGATTADNPLILGWDTDTWTGTLNLSNAESNANVGTLVNSTLVYLDTPLEPPLVFKVKATITGSDSSGNTGFWTGVFVNPEADAYTNLNGLRHLSSGVVRHNYMRNDGITAQNASYPTASKGSEYTYQISWDGADYISTFTAGGTDYPRNPSDEADTLKNAEAVYPGFFVVRQDITITEITIVNNTGPRELFVATNGSDSNSGTIGEPLATLAKAQELAAPGYTVYIRGGTYVIPESQIAAYWNSDVYACVFNMNKSGTADKRITYAAYPGDSRPVFDLSNVKPASKRVIGFHVTGSYLTFKGFDVTGVQVTILEHTQSESFRVGGNSAANNNIFENLAMHDSMAIGLYLYKGSNNLVLNCDAYDNWDSVSEGGSGENTDGFGGHPQTGSVNNVFRGCRAWRNADDGFDLIRAWEAVTIENCWAAYNGYSLTAGELVSRANGIGIKAGGWGMEAEESVPASIPRHTVRFSLSAENKNHGFYANHHLGGINWYNNTAYRNSNNFNMTNRKSLAEVVDVNGYGHVLKNNLSYRPRGQSGAAHLTNIDNAQCTLTTNSFELALEDSHFQSLDASQMLGARNTDGSLPSITFMKPAAGSPPVDAGTNIGYSFTGAAPDMGYTE